MTHLRIRWDRIAAIGATFIAGVFVGQVNGLPWYATAVLGAVCCVGAWSVMWR